MLRDVLGPGLRAHGFKGSGRNWLLTTDEGSWVGVNAQASALRTRDDVEFWLNLKVVNEAHLRWERDHEDPGSRPLRPQDAYGVWVGRSEPYEVVDASSAARAGEALLATFDGGMLAYAVELSAVDVLLAEARRSKERQWRSGTGPGSRGGHFPAPSMTIAMALLQAGRLDERSQVLLELDRAGRGGPELAEWFRGEVARAQEA